ncbi:MAG: DUF1003 domain-containing protein [Janthinobacterium lividum]
MGYQPWDELPFAWMQGATGVAALYMTILILVTQRREDQLASHREQLTLELGILSEQKAAKIIELLGESRRDLPHVRDRATMKPWRRRRPRTLKRCSPPSRTSTMRCWRPGQLSFPTDEAELPAARERCGGFSAERSSYAIHLCFNPSPGCPCSGLCGGGNRRRQPGPATESGGSVPGRRTPTLRRRDPGRVGHHRLHAAQTGVFGCLLSFRL